MKNGQEHLVIREAASGDARQIAEILVEDWRIAYRGIIDSAYLDSLSVENRYETESQRFYLYTVAARGDEILGLSWNRLLDGEDADCEIVALYVRCSQRRTGTGRALFQNAVDTFRSSGRKRMIVWCLRENREARKFYEKMGGTAYKNGTHSWGGREYDMISYLFRLDG